MRWGGMSRSGMCGSDTGQTGMSRSGTCGNSMGRSGLGNDGGERGQFECEVKARRGAGC